MQTALRLSSLGKGVEGVGVEGGAVRTHRPHPCYSSKTTLGRYIIPRLGWDSRPPHGEVSEQSSRISYWIFSGELFPESISVISKYILGLKQKASSLWWTHNNVLAYITKFLQRCIRYGFQKFSRRLETLHYDQDGSVGSNR